MMSMVEIDLTLGSYLKKLRNSTTLSLDNVKNSTGISKTSLIEWEHDKRVPSEFNLNKLAEFYNVDVIEFYHLIQLRGIPVIDKAYLGSMLNGKGEKVNMMVFDDALFQLNEIDQYYFTIKESDDMDKIGLIPGNLVLCRHTDTLSNGQIGIFKIDNELFMRQIQYINEKEANLVPHSYNNIYQKMKVNLDEIEILARVEKAILDFTNKNCN